MEMSKAAEFNTYEFEIQYGLLIQFRNQILILAMIQFVDS